MIANLNSLQVGLIFNAWHVTPGDNETSEQSLTTSDFNIRSAQDPIGYTKATPDPKHHGQVMRSSMRTEWIESQNLEMQGLWSRGVFQQVLRTSFCPQDWVLSTRFHYKIKRKWGEFDKCKVRLVVQAQHMKRKNADVVGDYDDLSAPYPLLAVFRPSSAWLHS